MTGTITRKMAEKGFGFIRAENKDYFFHHSQCITNFDSLNIEDEVRFELEKSSKGPRAKDVERI
jgi:CspA family cold shock protein